MSAQGTITCRLGASLDAHPIWQSMPKGRELDALVARHVFGWEFTEPRHGRCCTCGHCGRSSDDCAGRCEFSSDRDAAMWILDTGTFSGWAWNIHNDPAAGCTVQLLSPLKSRLPECGRAGHDEIGLAICRAALNALYTQGIISFEAAHSLPKSESNA